MSSLHDIYMKEKKVYYHLWKNLVFISHVDGELEEKRSKCCHFLHKNELFCIIWNCQLLAVGYNGASSEVWIIIFFSHFLLLTKKSKEQKKKEESVISNMFLFLLLDFNITFFVTLLDKVIIGINLINPKKTNFKLNFKLKWFKNNIWAVQKLS